MCKMIKTVKAGWWIHRYLLYCFLYFFYILEILHQKGTIQILAILLMSADRKLGGSK